MRFWAIRALGGLDLFDPATQSALLQAFTDPDADVRWAAADALYRHGIGEATETTREID